MSVRGAGCTIAIVAAPANARITLELEAGADPIRGSIEYPGGQRQPFWGWLELIDELGRLAAKAPQGRIRRRRRDSGGWK